MARTREQIVEEGIDKGLSNEQIAALVKSELAAAPAAPAAPVRAAPPPRPAPAAAPKPPPLATLATSRAKAPPPAEPAMEAMPAAVTPIVATAQTPPAAPVVAPSVRELTGSERAQRELTEANARIAAFQVLREEEADKRAREFESGTRALLFGGTPAAYEKFGPGVKTTFTAGTSAPPMSQYPTNLPSPEAGVMVKYTAPEPTTMRTAPRAPSLGSAATAAAALYAVPKAAYVGSQLASLLQEQYQDVSAGEADEAVLAARAQEPYYVNAEGRRVTAQGAPYVEEVNKLTAAERAVLAARGSLPTASVGKDVIVAQPRSAFARVGEGLLYGVGKDVEELQQGLQQGTQDLAEAIGKIPARAAEVAEEIAPYTLPGIRQAVGSSVFGERRRLTPEDLAFSAGGQLRANLRAVKTNPESFIAAGSPEQPYERVMTPKEAARSARTQFDAWSKRFPKEAAAAEAALSRENALQGVVAAFRGGSVPRADKAGLSQQEYIRLFQAAGGTLEQYNAGKVSPEVGGKLASAFEALSKASQ